MDRLGEPRNSSAIDPNNQGDRIDSTLCAAFVEAKLSSCEHLSSYLVIWSICYTKLQGNKIYRNRASLNLILSNFGDKCCTNSSKRRFCVVYMKSSNQWSWFIFLQLVFSSPMKLKSIFSVEKQFEQLKKTISYLDVPDFLNEGI